MNKMNKKRIKRKKVGQMNERKKKEERKQGERKYERKSKKKQKEFDRKESITLESPKKRKSKE